MFKPTNATTPEEYIDLIAEPRKTEIKKLFKFIKETLPKEKPYIQAGMIGFAPFHYKYASGREGDWTIIGLASQKNYISVYICAAKGKEYLAEKNKERLGKVSVGRSCIRFKKADDVNLDVLRAIIKEGVDLTKTHGFFST